MRCGTRPRSSFAGRVDRGRNAGGSASEHNDVETALDSLDSRGIDPVAGLQLRKQLAEIAPSYVQQLAVGKNGRNALNVQRGHLGLMNRPVDRLVLYARIQRSHRIEGLHDIGTVRTRQRHIGRQGGSDRSAPRTRSQTLRSGKFLPWPSALSTASSSDENS